MSIGFLSLRAKVDEDGYHVWISHVCKDDKRVTHMAPWSRWHLSEDGAKVEPSYSCDLCGTHGFASISSNHEWFYDVVMATDSNSHAEPHECEGGYITVDEGDGPVNYPCPICTSTDKAVSEGT